MPRESSSSQPMERPQSRVASHLHLVDWLFAKTQSARWGVTRAQFSAALERSVEHRFRGAQPTGAEVAAYLELLHADDLALACACSDGNDHAWEFFIAEFRQDLYAAARAIVCCSSGGGAGEARARELADSLYAELYGLEERAGKRRSLFDYFHGRSKLSTWLRAILAQRHVDTLRAGSRTDSLEAKDEAYIAAVLRVRGTPVQEDPDRAKFLAFLHEALQESLAALEPRDRLRLAFYYAEERTLAEIGRILGEHEATASRNLERTRRDLRRQVEQRLRAARSAVDGRSSGPGLSDAQIRLCYEYALEEWPYDLTRALADRAKLGGSQAKAGEK